jgi:hypothetical protein
MQGTAWIDNSATSGSACDAQASVIDAPGDGRTTSGRSRACLLQDLVQRAGGLDEQAADLGQSARSPPSSRSRPARARSTDAASTRSRGTP